MNKFHKLMISAVATGLAAASASSAEAQPAFQVTQAHRHMSEWKSLSMRVERALSQYAAGDVNGQSRDGLLAPLAVIEYPTQTFGRFDSFSAADSEQGWPALSQARLMRLYPTNDANTAFIEYAIPGSNRDGVAFIEMRGDLIVRIRDFSSTRQEVTAAAEVR
jgi:hypothetical protein